MTQNRIWIAVGLIVTGSLAAGSWLFGSSATDNTDESMQAVYICQETKQIVVGPRQPVPAVNPATGRKTLWRAMYCEQCERWYPVPPADSRPGNPLGRQCPKHRTPMSIDGPVE